MERHQITGNLFYMSLTLPPDLLLLATCYLLPPTLDNARLILHL